MNRGCLISLIVLVVFVLGIGGCGMSTYNGIIAGEETVTAAWGHIESQYKRRFDLIPQLVATVKGAAEYEAETLEAVVEARASVGRVQLPEGLPTDPAALEAYMSAQQGLGGALGRLFAVSESYPQLRATENFLSLQDQVEGTENRIAVARADFIEAVKRFNTSLRVFPGNFFATFFGFEKAAVLPAEEGTHESPTIDFGGDP